MEKSEQINELAAALSKAQAKIESATKSAKNPFYRSSYADLPACWDACRGPLTSNGLSVVQLMDTSENGIVLESVLLHSSGQWISCHYPVKPVKDDPQGLGSALTYSRRYSLMALVGLVADNEDDDGNAASGHKEPVSVESSMDAGLSRREHFKAEGMEAAEGGSYVLATWWKKLQPSEQRTLEKFKNETLKPIAEAVDNEAANKIGAQQV